MCFYMFIVSRGASEGFMGSGRHGVFLECIHQIHKPKGTAERDNSTNFAIVVNELKQLVDQLDGD